MEASFLIVFLALILAGTVFWIWALVDAIRAGKGADFRAGSQVVWVVVIAVFQLFGALAYVAFGRPRADPRAASRAAP